MLVCGFEHLEASIHSFQKIPRGLPWPSSVLLLPPKGVCLFLELLTLCALFTQHNFVHQSLSKILEFSLSLQRDWKFIQGILTRADILSQSPYLGSEVTWDKMFISTNSKIFHSFFFHCKANSVSNLIYIQQLQLLLLIGPLYKLADLSACLFICFPCSLTNNSYSCWKNGSRPSSTGRLRS